MLQDRHRQRAAERGAIVGTSERRRAVRFNGAIPVELKQGRGLTRDFSTDGVYFVTDQPLSLGEELYFVMHLNYASPAWPINQARPLRVRCLGDVVRMEPVLEKTGAAVTIKTHQFLME